MKRVLIGILAVVGLHSAAMAAGAIATSEQEDGVFIGLVVNYEHGFAAGKGALKECEKQGGINCTVAHRFEEACAAIAVGNAQSGEAVGAFSVRGDEKEAIKNAIATCEEDGENCAEYGSDCDGGKFVAEAEYSEWTIPQICTRLCSDFQPPEESADSLALAPRNSSVDTPDEVQDEAVALDNIPANAEDCVKAVEVIDRGDDGGYIKWVKKGHVYGNTCSVKVLGLVKRTNTRAGLVDTDWYSMGHIEIYRRVDKHTDPDYPRPDDIEIWELLGDYCYPDIEGSNNPDPCPE